MTAMDPARALFRPFEIRGMTIPNRIVVSPMCMYSAHGDGRPNDWHVVHLGSRAAGGAGLVFTEATAVSPEGRITPGDLGLWEDSQIPAHRRVVDVIQGLGAVPGIQLAHSGRKGGRSRPWEGNAMLAHEQWGTRWAPSPIPYRPEWPAPAEMSSADIASVVAAFAEAARRAHQAGYRVLEGHFAHGYLMHQFLSPLTNQRGDQYGGTLENRARFPLEAARALRANWPDDLPLFMRIPLRDWAAGGLDTEDAIQVALWLTAEGVDLIDGTSSGLVPGEDVPERPLYHLEMISALRQRVGTATAAVGRIWTVEDASVAVESGGADLVFLGRAMLHDAYWPRRAARALGAENPVAVPMPYRRSTQHLS
jgi:2,4-dienoyl-CoA reductase-like NADH-dependent reductase (Old Yellow Enzyme family)